MMCNSMAIKYFLIISIIVPFCCYGFEVNEDGDDAEIESSQGNIIIIIDEENVHFFGATLISEHILLTTAETLTQFKGKSHLGKMVKDEKAYLVHMTVIFYDYTPDNKYENNFGLAIFRDKLTTNLVKPVRLIEPQEKFAKNAKTRLTGASVNDPKTRSFYIDYMKLKECRDSIRNKQTLCNVVDQDSVEKTCHPLAGGAMFVKVQREKEVIVLSGLSLQTIPDCKNDTLVYALRTNIPEIFNWIQSIKESSK